MIPHSREFTRDLLQFAFMYSFRLLFGDVGAAYHHAVDDFLSTLFGGGPDEGFFVLMVDIRLGSTPIRVYGSRVFRSVAQRYSLINLACDNGL